MGSCTSETHTVENGEIRLADARDHFQDVSLDKIFVDGKNVGTLRTSRVIDGDSNDRNDRYQHWVENERGDTMGFVTDDGRAYRLRAHAGPELVASSDRMSINILAVFGQTEGAVVLERM